MKIRKPQVAILGVLLTAFAAGTMRFGHASDQARGETNRRESVYLVTGFIVIGISSDESRVWGYSTEVGGWREYRAQPGTRLQPIGAEQITGLTVIGHGIKEVAAFSSQTGSWSRCPLKAAVDGPVEAIVSVQVVCYQVDDYVYAFSGLTGSWDAVQTKAKPEVYAEKVIVRDGGRISVFSTKTGRWDSLDLRAL